VIVDKVMMMGHIALLLLFTAVSLPFRFGSSSLMELGSDVGIQVFNEVVKSKPQENVVLSPYGIASVLGMLQLGADGDTKKQLTAVMKYNVNERSLKPIRKLKKILTSKKNKDIVTIANAIFAQSDFKMEKPFVTRNKDVFQCEVKNLDFKDTEYAAATMNQWIKNKTKGMIDNLISPDYLDGALTKLVLLNTIYFKGLWKLRFPTENTKKHNFYGLDGKVYQVPMLSQMSLFNYGSTSTPNGLWYNMIELPYGGENISMLVALPLESSTPLSAIIPHISTKTIQSWMRNMRHGRVQITLPKFTAEAKTDLKEPLSALGITDMFDPFKANFAKITRSAPLSVSHVLQKAKVEVNEDGTKASAATSAVMLARSSSPRFTVDRPFLFFIRHNRTGAILFMGQITKP
uniref:Serpin family E member 2 n=1 Tax=Latimeria chalumnae TaxID=7897 RepID=H3A6M2_LATCH